MVLAGAHTRTHPHIHTHAHEQENENTDPQRDPLAAYLCGLIL